MYSLCLLLWLIPFANAVIAFNDEFELSAAVDIFMENDERMGELIGSYGMIEDWDVSSIKNFGAVFSKLRNPKAEFFTADLSKWDVSNAEYLHDMFLGAASFDSDLSNWQVGKVRRFNGLFNGAKSFTGKGLEQWDVSNGRFFMVTFADTQSLRQDLDLRSWKVSRAERMTAMFRGSNFGSNPNTNNLCGWRSHLRSLVETYAMFM